MILKITAVYDSRLFCRKSVDTRLSRSIASGIFAPFSQRAKRRSDAKIGIKMHILVNRSAVTPSTLEGLILRWTITHGLNEALRPVDVLETGFRNDPGSPTHTNCRRETVSPRAHARDDARAFSSVGTRKEVPWLRFFGPGDTGLTESVRDSRVHRAP